MQTSLKLRGWRGAAAALLMLTAGATSAYAAACPTVGDPQGWTGAFPQQLEIEEVTAAGASLTFTENPLFAEDVASGKLPPVAERLPEQPLVEVPYASCGVYGGTLEGRCPFNGIGYRRYPELAPGCAGFDFGRPADHCAERGAFLDLERRLHRHHL